MIGRWLFLLNLLVATPAIMAASPFVAGFDRFGGDNASEAGPLLLTELGCTACHGADDPMLVPKRGPVLDGAGHRLNPDWIRQFLTSPQQTKPGTTMPDVLSGLDAQKKLQAIEALTAFLATQLRPMPTLDSTASRPVAAQFWSKGDAAHGRQLYHQTGCVACHQADADDQSQPDDQSDDRNHPLLDEQELEELGLTQTAQVVRSVPHPDLPAKYNLQSLTWFLLDPLAIRPSGRMPNFKLTPDEAADITAYLFGDSGDPSQATPRPNPELVATGKQLFAELRCMNCHTIDGVSTIRPATRLADLDSASTSGCLDQAARGLPYYNIHAAERSTLRQAIGNRQQHDNVELGMMQLNCYACHERGDRGGVGSNRRSHFETVGQVDLGDEGRLPPALDGVGAKLTSDWINQVFIGKGDVRPHMTIRMPMFGQVTHSLTADFAIADQASAKSDPLADARPSAEAGRKLLDLGCVQCHPIRGEHLPGVVGVDLAAIDRRIRPGWFHEFLLDPASLKKRTRMPAFFHNGKSPSPELLDGHVDRQIASLWEYLKNTEKHPLPEKMQASRVHNFELIPTDNPIVLRTFMQHAGPHAIAVGFPEAVNLAFDAERVQLAQFWRGRFLDAHGTWFDRFTPPAIPLGDDVIELSNQAYPTDRKFDGYRLDRDGIPTFLYRINNVPVEDRIEPTDRQGFVRKVKCGGGVKAAVPNKIWCELISGTKLVRLGDNQYANQRGLTVSLKSNEAAEAKVQQQGTFFQWLVALDCQTETAIEVTYQW